MADKLLKLLPPVVRDYKELSVAMASQEEEIDRLWQGISDVEKEQFVEDATVVGVKRWESILGIVPSRRASLEERKFAILAQLNYKLPYSMRRLVQNLNELCGEEFYILDMEENSYELYFKLLEEREEQLPLARHLFEAFLPANIYYGMDLHMIPRVFQNTFALRFPDFQVASAFANFGHLITLDGSKLLGGEWLLDQEIVKGLPFLNFTAASRFKESNRIGVPGIQWDISSKNDNVLNFERFSVAASFDHFGYGIRLNGARRLNGVWRLNQGVGKGLPFPEFKVNAQFWQRNEISVPGIQWHNARKTESRLLFEDFLVKAAFGNFGPVIPLDGSKRMDGTWYMNQWIAKQLPFYDFRVGAGFEHRYSHSVQGLGGVFSVRLENRNVFDDLRMDYRFMNFGPLILMDGEQRLDGEWLLDQEIAKDWKLYSFGVKSGLSHEFGFGIVGMDTSTSAKNANWNQLDLEMKYRFGNFGNPILMDGDQTLDGEWILDQEYEKDLRLHLFKVEAGGFGNDEKNMHHQTFEARVSAANKNRFNAITLIKDSMYQLDGTYKLNGEVRVGSVTIEEEI